MMASLRTFVRLWAAVLAAALLVSAPAALAGDDSSHGRVPMPHISPAKGDQCVEPTDEMRRNHMDYILHQRDETVHQGVRTKQYSLAECINCHVTPDADGKVVSHKDPQHFCSSCHTYAAVKIDCFQCHTSQPEPAGQATSGGTGSTLKRHADAKAEAAHMHDMLAKQAAGSE